ncbi:aldo/keto reductase [Arenicella xantha]|uniref:Putative oxidoreductase n=1 Tax=Arenicella xantha TaxID=644221 RepID=A0A395JMR1_9GAMM|nr:aldo/keto reductase [Arenicella xantha]RBP52757.1 putative oxidoreductase [Arenicella xantha]
MSKLARVQMSPSGPSFSELVLGYWRMGDWERTDQQHLGFLEQHLELGITTVDHAHVYGSNPSCEEMFGRALKLAPALRDKIEIVSKCGIELVAPNGPSVNHYDSSVGAIIESVETSLRRLGVDHLDALLIHRPDWLMDADAVARAFEQLQVAGKVSHFGVSNFTSSQFQLLQSRLDGSLITNQIELNPLHLESIADGTLDYLQQVRVRPMAWSSLAGGRIFTALEQSARRVRKELEAISDELGASSIDQVIYAWVRQLPSRPVVVLGSGNIDRIQSAIDSIKLTLSRDQWYRIWVASTGEGVP